MRRAGTAILLAVAVAIAASCGGGGRGGGPTAPSSAAVITMGLTSLTPGGGLAEATLFFDSTQIARVDWSGLGGGGCATCQLVGTATNFRSGPHTISVGVVRQTRASVTYAVFGIVLVTDSAGARSFDLPRRNVTLRAGESVTYSISL